MQWWRLASRFPFRAAPAVRLPLGRQLPIGRMLQQASHGPSGGDESALARPTYTIEEVEAPTEVAAELRRAWFTKKNIKGSTKKLVPLARQVRGLSVNEAMAQMTFSGKRRSEVLRMAIKRACDRADFFHEMDPSQLMIEEVTVGKGQSAPRILPHSKGACDCCVCSRQPRLLGPRMVIVLILLLSSTSQAALESATCGSRMCGSSCAK